MIRLIERANRQWLDLYQEPGQLDSGLQSNDGGQKSLLILKRLSEKVVRQARRADQITEPARPEPVEGLGLPISAIWG